MMFLLEGEDLRFRKHKLLDMFIENRIIGIFILIVIVVSVVEPRFLDIRNLGNIVNQISINGIMALSMTILLISGAFDLSIGSILSFVGMLAVGWQASFGPINAIILAIAVGTLIGLLNGILVNYAKINSFIATLGTLILFKGLSLSLNNSRPIAGSNEGFMLIGGGSIGPIPIPALIFIIFILIFWFTMKWTSFGRNAYAIGGSDISAKLSGIRVNFYKTLYFVLSGFCASVSGVILASRLNTGSPNFGDDTPLLVIAAVVLGGTSLAGGMGNIRGTIFGILVIWVINNSLDLLNVKSYYQMIIRGTIIILVVLIDAIYERRRAEGRLRLRKISK